MTAYVKLLMILVFVYLSLSPGTVLKAQTGEIYFSPDSVMAEPNDIIEIDIMADANLNQIHCYKLMLYFDRNYLELIEVVEGSLLSDQGPTWLFVNDTMEQYDIANCLLGPGLYANGPGHVVTLKLKTKSSGGGSELLLSDHIFQDTELDTIPSSASGGYVSIESNYTCGDANSDVNVDVSDAVYIINYAFAGGDAPNPVESGDANCDSQIDVSDAVYLINYAFAGGNPPCDLDHDGSPEC
ncbi:MAG: hypothetical protein GF404_10075 [candidate division Zixibacteria bacterium]|nr:hypothetical protein [candidate division Zixibacteria bacterium]